MWTSLLLVAGLAAANWTRSREPITYGQLTVFAWPDDSNVYHLRDKRKPKALLPASTQYDPSVHAKMVMAYETRNNSWTVLSSDVPMYEKGHTILEVHARVNCDKGTCTEPDKGLFYLSDDPTTPVFAEFEYDLEKDLGLRWDKVGGYVLTYPGNNDVGPDLSKVGPHKYKLDVIEKPGVFTPDANGNVVSNGDGRVGVYNGRLVTMPRYSQAQKMSFRGLKGLPWVYQAGGKKFRYIPLTGIEAFTKARSLRRVGRVSNPKEDDVVQPKQSRNRVHELFVRGPVEWAEVKEFTSPISPVRFSIGAGPAVENEFSAVDVFHAVDYMYEAKYPDGSIRVFKCLKKSFIKRFLSAFMNTSGPTFVWELTKDPQTGAITWTYHGTYGESDSDYKTRDDLISERAVIGITGNTEFVSMWGAGESTWEPKMPRKLAVSTMRLGPGSGDHMFKLKLNSQNEHSFVIDENIGDRAVRDANREPSFRMTAVLKKDDADNVFDTVNGVYFRDARGVMRILAPLATSETVSEKDYRWWLPAGADFVYEKDETLKVWSQSDDKRKMRGTRYMYTTLAMGIKATEQEALFTSIPASVVRYQGKKDGETILVQPGMRTRKGHEPDTVIYEKKDRSGNRILNGLQVDRKDLYTHFDTVTGRAFIGIAVLRMGGLSAGVSLPLVEKLPETETRSRTF